jgi:hypothetical protein
MACGKHLVNAVAALLDDKPKTTENIRGLLGIHYSGRAIRYAVTELIKENRAKRSGRMIYAEKGFENG